MNKLSVIIITCATVYLVACSGEQKNSTEDQEAPKQEQAVVESTAEPQVETSVVEASEVSSDSTTIAYVCPPCGCSMHDSTFTAPGVCPACNMPLAKKSTD